MGLQAVNHVGDRAGRDMEYLADLAHGAVSMRQGLEEPETRQ
jgi:hypothetical protein